MKIAMKLKRQLPPNRTYEEVKHHYLVEKSIAKRIKNASREERKLIYPRMYEELFSKEPKHPRLTREQSAQLTSSANKVKFSIVGKFLDKSDIFVEFAPGDCRFSFAAANQVYYAYGVDISDQRHPTRRRSPHADYVPDNFTLIVYDGYNLDEIDDNSIDIVFSDQLIEHFHPEDTRLHFKLVHRILKPGGKYVFRTPHPLSGPHDVSQYFSDEPEGFHLKEWTYIEMKSMIMDLKYSHFHTHWHAKRLNLRIPYAYFAICEQVLGLIPKRFRYIRAATKYLLPTLCGDLPSKVWTRS